MLNGFRRAVIDVRTEGQALAQATADDLKQQGRHAAIGSGFGAGAALLTIFAIGFLLATITYLLSLFLPTWLALTIMTLALFGAVAALVFLARSQFRKVPGVPQPAVRGPQRERFALALRNLQSEAALSAKARARVPVITGAAGFVLGGGLRGLARLRRRS